VPFCAILGYTDGTDLYLYERKELSVPTVFCYGLALFVCSLVTQVIVWRSGPIKNQPARLAFIFLILPIFLMSICEASALSHPNLPPGTHWQSLCLAYLLDLSLSLAYMLVYSAVAAFSPSIAILERVEENMPQGLPREELVPPWFSDENLAGARHHNLVSNGLVSYRDANLVLEFKGRFVARCFLIFRRFLGLPDLAKG